MNGWIIATAVALAAAPAPAEPVWPLEVPAAPLVVPAPAAAAFVPAVPPDFPALAVPAVLAPVPDVGPVVVVLPVSVPSVSLFPPHAAVIDKHAHAASVPNSQLFRIPMALPSKRLTQVRSVCLGGQRAKWTQTCWLCKLRRVSPRLSEICAIGR
jgi:hypothetical protein